MKYFFLVQKIDEEIYIEQIFINNFKSSKLLGKNSNSDGLFFLTLYNISVKHTNER
jgi:hypothetical protein